MEQDQYYFTLDSDEMAKGFFKHDTTPSHVWCKLWNPLSLKGKWELGLVTCLLETTEQVPLIQLVQTPIINHVMVVEGKTFLPTLMHLVKMEDNQSKWTFDPPTYVPVNQSFIETLEVYLTDHKGEPSVAQGRSVYVLHLRKCKD